MKEYNLFGYSVEVDKQATKEWYGKFKGWKCDCEHCKNFLLLAKKKQLPVIILDTLKEFEIPPEKPTYVCEITSKKDQLLYQFSYRMAGNILQEKADEPRTPNQNAVLENPAHHTDKSRDSILLLPILTLPAYLPFPVKYFLPYGN